MSFAWPRFCQIVLLACSVVLSACGGGGGDAPSGSANITVNEGSFYVPEGSFDSVAAEQRTQSFALIGATHIALYDMGAFGAGVAYALDNPAAFSFAVLTPNELDYSCVSQAWLDSYGETSPVCPETMVLNTTTRRLQFTNAVLQRSDLPSDTVTVSGVLTW